MYIETSWPRKDNDTARLISSSVPGTTGTTGKCLSFWYHMYGADINRLSVYVRTGQSGSQHDTRLWNKAGSQGDKWIQAKMTATARSAFQVFFYFIYFALNQVKIYNRLNKRNHQNSFVQAAPTWPL